MTSDSISITISFSSSIVTFFESSSWLPSSGFWMERSTKDGLSSTIEVSKLLRRVKLLMMTSSTNSDCSFEVMSVLSVVVVTTGVEMGVIVAFVTVTVGAEV